MGAFSALSESDPQFVLAAAWSLPFLLTLSFGIFLWCFSPSIAQRIFASIEGTVVEGYVDPKALQVLALSVIGVFLIVQAIPEAVQIITNWIQLSNLPSSWKDELKASAIAQLFKLTVMLVFGVWLALGSKRIATSINKFQSPAVASTGNDQNSMSD